MFSCKKKKLLIGFKSILILLILAPNNSFGECVIKSIDLIRLVEIFMETKYFIKIIMEYDQNLKNTDMEMKNEDSKEIIMQIKFGRFDQIG